jgi:16S rRNA (uracil1498-N3)-methyltransferase
MVVRGTRPTVATVFVAGPMAVGGVVAIGADGAHHMRVRRLDPGARIRIVNGAGDAGGGTLTLLGRFRAEVALDEVWSIPAPSPIHLIVPVADRERMLWLAEKCTELGIASWRPAVWERSRSVSPRGEGPRFREKVLARAIGALEQSGGGWLPEILAEGPIEEVVRAAPAGARWVLDPDGEPLLGSRVPAPLTLALGPEGGISDAERGMLATHDVRFVSLGPSILRFETAGVGAVAAIRAARATRDGVGDGD